MSIFFETLLQSLASVAASLVFGLCMGGAIVQLEFARGRRFSNVRSMLEAVFSFPGSILALSLLAVIASLSLGEWLGLGAVVLVHAIQNAPWITSRMLKVLDRARQGRVEALELMGCSPLLALARSERVALIRGVAQASSQVGLICFLSFSSVLLLGGGRLESVELEIFWLVRAAAEVGPELRWTAFASILGCAFWVGLGRWMMSGHQMASRVEAYRLDPKPISNVSRAGSAVILVFWMSAIFILIFSPIYSGLLAWWTGGVDVSSIAKASGQSVVTALSAAFLATGIGGATFFLGGRVLGRIATWSLVISPSLVCASCFLLWPEYWNPIDGGQVLSIVTLGLLFLPWAVWLFSEHAGKRSEPKRECLELMGANTSQLRYWLSLRPTLFVSVGVFALICAWCLGDIVATSYFAGESYAPLSVSLLRYSGQYRFDQASFGVLVWGLLCGAPLWVSTRFLRYEANS